MTNDEQILNHLIDLKAGQARVEATLVTTVKMYDDKFEAIQKDISKRDTRQWIVSACVVPLVMAIRIAANRIGWRV